MTHYLAATLASSHLLSALDIRSATLLLGGSTALKYPTYIMNGLGVDGADLPEPLKFFNSAMTLFIIIVGYALNDVRIFSVSPLFLEVNHVILYFSPIV